MNMVDDVIFMFLDLSLKRLNIFTVSFGDFPQFCLSYLQSFNSAL